MIGKAAATAAVLVLITCSKAVSIPNREVYTSNAICIKQNCVNPIFPGLEDLQMLSEANWYCSSLSKAAEHMGFCRAAINYDPAVPGSADATPLETMVQRQDNAASTAFVYHLAGLGYEAWQYNRPEFSGDDCIKSIWRLVCYTYFPRSQIGCQEGGLSKYHRPCQSSCANYVRQCGVECCDESVQCVFSHTKALSNNTFVTTSGYAPHDAPSSLCTGGARRRAQVPRVLLGLLVLFCAFGTCEAAAGEAAQVVSRTNFRHALALAGLVLISASLQGCGVDVPAHTVGNWRAEKDYLLAHEFIPPGGSIADATLNSCAYQRLSSTLQCSGRGVCKMWDTENMENTLAFCECDRDWADPECKTRRKSQKVAFFLSLFLGMFGADQFYMGFPLRGMLKLLSLGGFGAWWLVDVIRIGSAPVHASKFQVAADLPHAAFVLISVIVAVLLGFAFAYTTTMKNKSSKRKEALMMSVEEERKGQFSGQDYGSGNDRPQVYYGSAPFNPRAAAGQSFGAGAPMRPAGSLAGGAGAQRINL